MKPSQCSVIVALMFGLSPCGIAEPPPAIKELIAQIRTELQADMKNARDNDRGIDRQWQLSSVILQIERAFDDEAAGYGYDMNQSVAALQSFASSEKMQQLTQALASEAGREFAAREKATVVEIDKLIETHVAPALDAKTAADLDAPLAALHKAQQQGRYRESRTMQGAAERLRQATEFLTHWQDYLAAKEAGRADQARSALSNLTGSGREYSFIPRSKLLALANSLTPERGASAEPKKASLSELLAKIKTLDDLVAAKPQLSALNFTSSEQSSLATGLRMLADSYSQIKAGQAVSLRLSSTELLSSAEIAPLREQFFAFALPRILLLDEEACALKPGEKVVTYLTRMLAEAQKKQDWALVGRIVSTSRSLNVLENVTAGTDSSTLTQFLAGLNQERAKQFSLAVASFQAALKTGSDIVPPELIGEHLEKIRTEHPQDFEQGVQLALNPPAPVSSDPRSMRPPFGLGFPGYPGSMSGRYTIGPDGRPVPVGETTTVAIPAKATPAPKPPAEPAK